jgi:hypothetical protein
VRAARRQAAWKAKARDEWIGWDATQRRHGLPRLASNARFLVLPWVRVPHPCLRRIHRGRQVASHLLGCVVRRIDTDWRVTYGHGKKHLSSLLAAMNMLAHLTHTFLSYCDEAYRLIRAKLPTRKTFFEHVRTLMHYIDFPSWEAMMDFMMRGLEIGPYAVADA